MSELLAIDGSTVLDFRDITHSGTITIVPSVKSPVVKCNGDSVYTSIVFVVSAFSGGGISVGTGAGAIDGSTVKTKIDSGSQPVREQDEVEITITDSVSPYGTTTTTVYVKTAGQTKAKAE